ncbi:MAG: hypothetical protein M0Q43_02310 [Methanothrix sp.]|nr:hypothetical protein [Methanothrix sp.]
MRYGLYRATRPKVTGAADEHVAEQPGDLSDMSCEIVLPSTAQEIDNMPAQKWKPTREEWDRLSKREQWELIKNMDLKEATKGMSDSERASYIENLQKVSNAVEMGAGNRILHYVTISGYINRPNAILLTPH